MAKMATTVLKDGWMCFGPYTPSVTFFTTCSQTGVYGATVCAWATTETYMQGSKLSRVTWTVSPYMYTCVMGHTDLPWSRFSHTPPLCLRLSIFTTTDTFISLKWLGSWFHVTEFYFYHWTYGCTSIVVKLHGGVQKGLQWYLLSLTRSNMTLRNMYTDTGIWQLHGTTRTVQVATQCWSLLAGFGPTWIFCSMESRSWQDRVSLRWFSHAVLKSSLLW